MQNNSATWYGPLCAIGSLKNNPTASDKVAIPLELCKANGKQFRQMSDVDKSFVDFIKAALLEGYGVVFDGLDFGTLDALLRKNQLAKKYNYHAIMRLDHELPDAELADAVLDICIKATAGNRKAMLAFGFNENLQNMKGKLPGSQITREDMVSMLLWNHQLVIAKSQPMTLTMDNAPSFREPPFVIGTLSQIREAIRSYRRGLEGQDIIRREKLAAYEADLPDSLEKVEAMDPVEARATLQKHFPDHNPPDNFPQPADFDPTLSDQDLAEQIIDTLEPFFEGQSVICLAFGRREGQHWPDVPENTREWSIACLINGLFMFMQGVETKRILDKFGTLSDIREMSRRQRLELAAS